MNVTHAPDWAPTGGTRDMARDNGASVTVLARQADELAGSAATGFMWIPVEEIHIDPTYQRNLDRRRVAEMAANWNPSLADPIRVNWRSNGDIYCIDGQHRLEAARLAGVHSIECKVHADLTLEQEAAMFELLQTNRATLNSAMKFRARLVAHEADAMVIEHTVREFGGTPDYTNSTTGVRPVRAFSALENVYAHGMTHFRRVLTMLTEAWPTEPQVFSERLLGGMHIFLSVFGTEVDDARLIEQLRKVDPQKVLRDATAYREQVGGKVTQHIAVEFVKAYNKHLRVGHLDFERLRRLPRSITGTGRVRAYKRSVTSTLFDRLNALETADTTGSEDQS